MTGDRQFDLIGSQEELEQHGADRLCPTPADPPGVIYSFS